MKSFEMPSDKRTSNAYADPSGVMGSSLNLEHASKRQQNSKKVRDAVFPANVKQTQEYQNKLKPTKFAGQSHSSLPHQLRQDGSLVHPKIAENRHQHSLKARGKKDDELVKYMSNLPDYLRHMEKEENVQDKALNVGVLDWKRLENWRGNQKCKMAIHGDKVTSIGNNLSSNMTVRSDAIHPKTLACQSEQHPSACSSQNASRNGDILRSDKPSVQNVIRFQDVETASKSSLVGQRNLQWTYRSFGQSNPEVMLEKEKRQNSNHNIASEVDNQSSNLRHYGALETPKKTINTFGGKSKKRVEEMQLPNIDNEAQNQKITSRIEASSSRSRNSGASLDSKVTQSIFNNETKRTERLKESAAGVSLQYQPVEKKNIVLLLPKKKVSKYLSEETPRPTLNQNGTVTEDNCSSAGISCEATPTEFCSEISHSCPLSSGAECYREPRKMVHDMISSQVEEMSSDVSRTSPCLHRTPIMKSLHHAEKGYIRATYGNAADKSKILDQETAELATPKGRHPSPNRRFSFSLGRMTRSFSFKESSAVPELSSSHVSVKSGPVMTHASASVENSNKEKTSSHNRARSSPLRRILDPLLKSRSTGTSCSAETGVPLKGSLNSSSLKPVKDIESLQNEKLRTSSVQAVLQLKMKNGLPIFRFRVNNSSSVLAATTGNVMSCGKNDSGNNYTFYAIDEIKKKGGGWRNQGSKEKSCGYVYNVIGQMKVNSSSFFDASGQNSIRQYMVKESVLFGVEVRQGDQASSPKFILNSELAAIVIKMPKENLILDVLKRDKDSMENGLNKCSWNLGEHEHPLNVTAILPGAIHSLPDKGVPSPLIHRWKSGGSCDCGGWDVGCKLHILSNENQCSKISTESNACLTSNRLKLFTKGGAPRDKPIFSLALIDKEMYSIEFNSSISLLQAFFISVTAISCQKLSDLAEVGNLSEENVNQEAGNVNDRRAKSQTVVQGKAPAKYTPNPPLSPVGRV